MARATNEPSQMATEVPEIDLSNYEFDLGDFDFDAIDLNAITPEQWQAAAAYTDGSYDPQGKITQSTIDNALSDKDEGVADLTATLHRNEWDDWQDRYLPMINQEAENILNGTNIKVAEEQAAESVTQSFDNAQRGMTLNNNRLGIQQTQAQQNQQTKSMGLSETAQMVDKVNDARVGAKDRDLAIVSGGLNGSINTAKDDT